MKAITFSLPLCALLLLSWFACAAQQNPTAGPPPPPPPPADEYFPQKWVKYVSESGNFKIKFPKSPREYFEIQNGLNGQATVYIAEYKGLLLYVASYSDSPAPIFDVKVFLQNISNAWFEANSARKLQIVRDDEIWFMGYQGRFLQVENEREVVRVRWLVVKDHIYYQFVAAPKHKNAMASDNGYEKLALSFFDSFEIGK